jgi:NTP pyrophosphatase (non-canonical NTP hydrolase)
MRARLRPSSRRQQKASRADKDTTVAQLKAHVEEFVAQRKWAQFHSAKNLAMALAVEAAELMDLFKWYPDEEAVARMWEPACRLAAAEELADVFILGLAFANRYELDVATAIRSKLRRNRAKYPVSRFRGRF